MSKQRHDITPDTPTAVNEQQLLDYLNNRLDATQRAVIEQQLQASEMMQDAREGLQLINNKAALPEILARINRNLITQLQKKRRRTPKALPSQQLLLTTVLILLLLVVLAFVVIFRMKGLT